MRFRTEIHYAGCRTGLIDAIDSAYVALRDRIDAAADRALLSAGASS